MLYLSCGFIVSKVQILTDLFENMQNITPAYISGIAGRPGRVSVFLIYKHDGKIYKRGVGYYPRIETFSMKPPREGDSCIVAYDSLNPRYCTIYKDFRR